MGLTAKQQIFIDEYLVSFNATDAARKAGYSERSIRAIASENLTKPDIKNEIERRLQEKHLTKDIILARLADMSLSNIADFADIKSSQDLKEVRDIAHVIKKFKRKVTTNKDGEVFEEIELELYPADVNLERVGKHLGLFKDQIEVSGNVGMRVIGGANLDEI